MNCTHCGRALDAQALELGACRYCGTAIPSMGLTTQHAQQPGAGNTSPTQPKRDALPSNTMWTENALTEFGPLSYGPANTPPQGTTPFAVNTPPAYAPPPGGGFAQPGAHQPYAAPPA